MTKAQRQKLGSLRFPSGDEWTELSDWIEREPELSGCSRPAIENAVCKAIELFRQIMHENSEYAERNLVIRKAKRVQLLMSKLAHELQGQESQRQLRSIKADEQFAHLLSFSAVHEEFENSELARPMEVGEFAAFVSKAEFRKETPSLANFDRQFVDRRKKAIGEDTGRMMLHAVHHLKKPFDEWLFAARQHKGGRPANTARRALLFHLIMDYENIFNTRLTPQCEGHLVSLATHLFPRCGLKTAGIDRAVSDAIADFMPVGAWLALPPAQPSTRQ